MRTVSLLLWVVAFAACNVFDERLYLDRDGGGAQDGGADGGGDGGPTTVDLADSCQGEVALLQSSSESVIVDTTGLDNTFDELSACLGHDALGNDGFVGVEMVAGERWHFHVKVTGEAPTVNPSVYVLQSCDDRSCAPGEGLDECGAGRDEHLSFVAPQADTFYVAIDSREAGGDRFELLALQPTCGDGTPEHSETCDDGDTESEDGCDNGCRAEIGKTLTPESEPNDEPLNANVIVLAGGTGVATVAAGLGERCDFDTFAVDVPAGGAIRATVSDENGAPCTGPSPPLRLTLHQPDGFTVRGSVTGGDGGDCPAITDLEPFAVGLQADEYYVRVAEESEPVPFRYQIRIEVVGP